MEDGLYVVFDSLVGVSFISSAGFEPDILMLVS
jgi:hypothetical protein